MRCQQVALTQLSASERMSVMMFVLIATSNRVRTGINVYHMSNYLHCNIKFRLDRLQSTLSSPLPRLFFSLLFFSTSFIFFFLLYFILLFLLSQHRLQGVLNLLDDDLSPFMLQFFNPVICVVHFFFVVCTVFLKVTIPRLSSSAVFLLRMRE